MRLRDRLFPSRKIPKPIRRVLIRCYPFTPAPRPYADTAAGRILTDRLDAEAAGYAGLCREIVKDRAHFTGLRRKPAEGEAPGADPHWINGYFPPLDGLILYTLLRLRKPKTYLEIGSGNSTKFARKAIRDHNLPTRIVSIDPNPRAEIDALCDEIIRRPFQEVGADAASRLAPGDMLFQDGSHHIFTNSDATVFFTELLPILPRDLVWGVHDIFLPDDYPVKWHRRFYNEQYLFLTYLLAGAAGDRVLFPACHIGRTPDLSAQLSGIFDLPALEGIKPHGGAFWMHRA